MYALCELTTVINLSANRPVVSFLINLMATCKRKRSYFLSALDEGTEHIGEHSKSDLPAGHQISGSLCTQCRSILVQYPLPRHKVQTMELRKCTKKHVNI